MLRASYRRLILMASKINTYISFFILCNLAIRIGSGLFDRGKSMLRRYVDTSTSYEAQRKRQHNRSHRVIRVQSVHTAQPVMLAKPCNEPLYPPSILPFLTFPGIFPPVPRGTN